MWNMEYMNATGTMARPVLSDRILVTVMFLYCRSHASLTYIVRLCAKVDIMQDFAPASKMHFIWAKSLLERGTSEQ